MRGFEIMCPLTGMGNHLRREIDAGHLCAGGAWRHNIEETA